MSARLVRDKMHNFFPPGQLGSLRPVEDREEHLRLLRQKIIEEAGELALAPSAVAAAIEAPDLIETIFALMLLLGIDEQAVARLRERKWQERGGFTQGVVLDPEMRREI